MRRGISLGESALALLGHDYVVAVGGDGPNIEQATERIAHLDGTKAELSEALAYAALQAGAYRHMSNQDAALALLNIESVLRDYRERRP